MSNTITDIAERVAGLYKELVTNTVRFEELQKNTDKMLSKFELVLERLVDKVTTQREEHIREQATMRAQIELLQGRINNLGEQALHAVAREAARDIMRESLVRPDSGDIGSTGITEPSAVSSLPAGNG